MRRPFAMTLLAAVLATACGERTPVPGDASLQRLQDDGGRIEWRGTLPCADCEGIETLLALERVGDARRYDLVEVYLAAEGPVRFEEGGEWRLQGGLLDLEADAGGLRHYAILPGGGLQPRDARGRAFDGRGDTLQPTDAFLP